jgi:DNA-binding transcriptional MerR regulator
LQKSEPVVGGVDDALYTIGQVADLLGVPAPTIRSWERRHGLPVGVRTAVGHRRYGPADVTALQRMRDELAAGLGAAEAAEIASATLTSPPTVLTEQLCGAAEAFDPALITQVLDDARTVHGLTATVELVLLPALAELGRRWAAGTSDVAHEHIATATTQSWLRTTAQVGRLRSTGPPVVLACGPDEQHTLGLDALATLLAHTDTHCLNLGAQVPAESLKDAVLDTRAHAVVLSCQLDRNRRAAITALRVVADSPAALFYAGAAFSTAASRRGVPGHYLGDSVSRAADHLSRLRPTPEPR